jgi:hypothetical protein
MSNPRESVWLAWGEWGSSFLKEMKTTTVPPRLPQISGWTGPYLHWGASPHILTGQGTWERERIPGLRLSHSSHISLLGATPPVWCWGIKKEQREACRGSKQPPVSSSWSTQVLPRAQQAGVIRISQGTVRADPSASTASKFVLQND